MAGDLFWPYVYVGMHMDDTGLTDVKGHAMTLTGGAARSATQSKFGGYSAYFDGVDDEIMNSSPIYDISDYAYQSFQFFCYPETQVDTNPCVLQFRNYRIEYKPSGFPNGFVVNADDGTRTACGAFSENQWYYIFGVEEAGTLTLYIDGNLIGAFPSTASSPGPFFYIGSAGLSPYPNTAFKGYVDDLLLTREANPTIQGHKVRWDTTVPTSAFPEKEPDPEGVVSGSMTITGSIAGMAPPNGPVLANLAFTGPSIGVVSVIGTVSASLKFNSDVDGMIYIAGITSGKVRLTGVCDGVIGSVASVDGNLMFTGEASGSLGIQGIALGSIGFTGNGQAKHGSGGVVSGAVQFVGSASGSTPMLPTGNAYGLVRFTGNGIGSSWVIDGDECQ